VKSYKRVID